MAIITIGFNPAIDRILECPGFHIGGHQQARQITRLASGKSANVSRALAQLGSDSIATGFVGTEEIEFFHEQLLSAGPGRILCRFVEVGGETRENITILDPDRHVETHIRDRGFTVTPQEIELLEKKIAHDLKPGDIAAFSGSLCQGLPSDYFATIIERCSALNAKVVIDSNGEPLKIAARKKLWVLKPNLEEIRQLLGVEVPNAAAALRDAAMPLLANIEHLLISRGPQGAVLLTPRGCYNARNTSRSVPVRTVGCGDHLLAGFISELAAGRDVERALLMAMAVASARALSPKMDEYDPSLMQAAINDIAIEKI
jgi:1-phosphofructokinase family hexose kinase